MDQLLQNFVNSVR